MNNVLNINDLEFCYKKDSSSAPLIKVKKFQLSKGEKVFLQGDSGSGKTTLLGLVTGILTANKGEVSVLGENFTSASHAKRDAIRGNKMGYVFQLFNLIPYLSVSQNIELPCRLHAERRMRLKGKDLNDEVKRLASELSIDKYLHSPVSDLSVGQQQRVAAARALIGSPEFIIADEPTSSLDYNQRGRFIELLMEECEREKTSLLFVSHDPTLAQFFHRTVQMQEINSAPKGDAT